MAGEGAGMGRGGGDEGKARTRKRLELQPRKELDRHRAGTARAATAGHCSEGREKVLPVKRCRRGYGGKEGWGRG